MGGWTTGFWTTLRRPSSPPPAPALAAGAPDLHPGSNRRSAKPSARTLALESAHHPSQDLTTFGARGDQPLYLSDSTPLPSGFEGYTGWRKGEHGYSFTSSLVFDEYVPLEQ